MWPHINSRKLDSFLRGRYRITKQGKRYRQCNWLNFLPLITVVMQVNVTVLRTPTLKYSRAKAHGVHKELTNVN